jgi:hypothetical protein
MALIFLFTHTLKNRAGFGGSTSELDDYQQSPL